MVPFGIDLRITAIAAPLLALLVTVLVRRRLREVAFAAALVSALASLRLLWTAPPNESLDEAVMLLFSMLTLAGVLVIPRRDCTLPVITGMLFLLGSTLLGYSSGHLLVLLGAWAVSTVPFILSGWLGAASWRPRAALLASTAALGAAIAVIAATGHGLSISVLKGQNPGGIAVLALLVLAVIFRKGICPAHAWVPDAVETGSPVPTALFLNCHFGAFLVAKVIVPLFPRPSHNVVPVLSYLALVTALYVAIRSVTENSPRRLLALIALSQSACILAGLESQTTEGITGALVHWCVVTVSTLGLFGVLRLLEVRFGENLTAASYLGLAEHAPRLAVYFAVFGLALVGLPGTLSFCAQDLLIHGTLASHLQTGLLLPVATAINAVSIFRLFARLFLGRHRTGFTIAADALPRERWILSAGVVFVVLAGLFPNTIVALQSAEAETVAQAIHAPTVVTPPAAR